MTPRRQFRLSSVTLDEPDLLQGGEMSQRGRWPNFERCGSVFQGDTALGSFPGTDVPQRVDLAPSQLLESFHDGVRIPEYIMVDTNY